MGRVVPDRRELVGRAVEGDAPANEEEPLRRRARPHRTRARRRGSSRRARRGARRAALRASPARPRRRRSSARRGRAGAGSVASALAMNARCCRPPERVRSGASARSASPTRSIASRHGGAIGGAAAGRAARAPRADRRRRARGRSTGAPVPAWARCGEVAEPRRHRAAPGAAAEQQRARPLSGCSSPRTSRSRVVLPPPFGPAIADELALRRSPGRRPRAPAGRRPVGERRLRRARDASATDIRAPCAAPRGCRRMTREVVVARGDLLLGQPLDRVRDGSRRRPLRARPCRRAGVRRAARRRPSSRRVARTVVDEALESRGARLRLGREPGERDLLRARSAAAR